MNNDESNAKPCNEPVDGFRDSGSSPPTDAPNRQQNDVADGNDSNRTNLGRDDSQERKTHTRLKEIFREQVTKVLKGTTGVGYVMLKDGRVYEATSRHVANGLKARFMERHTFLPTDQALASFIGTVEFEAVNSPVAHDVRIRVASSKETIYIDLGTPDGSCIEVTPSGWRVVKTAPVYFRRVPGMLPLPLPTRGESIELLRKHLRCSDGQFKLVVGWLLGAFCPFIEYPILEFTGPQGSAKSTTMGLVRALVDPAQSDRRSAPKSERDIFLAANGGWVISLDNLSRVNDAVSDALCMAATGGTYAARKLYSDGDEYIANCKNPVILNGLYDITWKSDLLERVLAIRLPALSKAERKGTSELRESFEAERAIILGALLDAVSCALKNWDATQAPPEGWPRMADFSRFVTAAEPAVGWHAGTFVRIMHETRRHAAEGVLDDYPGLIKVMSSLPYRRGEEVDTWTGSATELLEFVKAASGGEPPDYAKSASSLSKLLGKLHGPLKELGFDWREGQRQASQRWLIITRAVPTSDE